MPAAGTEYNSCTTSVLSRHHLQVARRPSPGEVPPTSVRTSDTITPGSGKINFSLSACLPLFSAFFSRAHYWVNKYILNKKACKSSALSGTGQNSDLKGLTTNPAGVFCDDGLAVAWWTKHRIFFLHKANTKCFFVEFHYSLLQITEQAAITRNPHTHTQKKHNISSFSTLSSPSANLPSPLLSQSLSLLLSLSPLPPKLSSDSILSHLSTRRCLPSQRSISSSGRQPRRCLSGQSSELPRASLQKHRHSPRETHAVLATSFCVLHERSSLVLPHRSTVM